jgi:hypothetical protein
MTRERLTGAQLVFEGGSLGLDFRKRRGNFAFTDEQLEPVREYDEDGVWDGFLVKLPNSELEAIRDFLNKWLPPQPPCTVFGVTEIVTDDACELLFPTSAEPGDGPERLHEGMAVTEPLPIRYSPND